MAQKHCNRAFDFVPQQKIKNWQGNEKREWRECRRRRRYRARVWGKKRGEQQIFKIARSVRMLPHGKACALPSSMQFSNAK